MFQGDKFNLLCDKLPESVKVDGVDYPIFTAFRDWISFFNLHEDNTLRNKEKITIAMNWYKGDKPENIIAAYSALQEFAECSELPKDKKSKTGASNTPVFSYLHDSLYLFSDFMRYYNVNLQKEKNMHWYIFKSLFEGLPEESSVKKRIAYRSINTSDIKDKNERMRIIKIKNSIKIPTDNITANEIGNIFWNMGGE